MLNYIILWHHMFYDIISYYITFRVTFTLHCFTLRYVLVLCCEITLWHLFIYYITHVYIYIYIYHTVLYHIILYHIVSSYHIISYHITSHQIISYHTVLHRIISYYIILWYNIVYEIVVCVYVHIYTRIHVYACTRAPPHISEPKSSYSVRNYLKSSNSVQTCPKSFRIVWSLAQND